MSVSLRELKLATRPLTERILEILRSKPEEAFDIVDLFARTNGSDPAMAAMILLMAPEAERRAALHPYEEALLKLVQEGAVEKELYRGQLHYFLARP